jgi:hypothetical protein
MSLLTFDQASVGQELQRKGDAKYAKIIQGLKEENERNKEQASARET